MGGKRESWKRWTLALSIISFLLSLASVVIAYSLHDKEILPDFSAMAVGVLGILVTLLVTWQIYSSLQIHEHIRQADERTKLLVEERIQGLRKEIESEVFVLSRDISNQREEIGELNKRRGISVEYQYISDKMALKAFNAPNDLARELSRRIGVGKLNEWKMAVGELDDGGEYIAITPYYLFGEDALGMNPNAKKGGEFY